MICLACACMVCFFVLYCARCDWLLFSFRCLYISIGDIVPYRLVRVIGFCMIYSFLSYLEWVGAVIGFFAYTLRRTVAAPLCATLKEHSPLTSFQGFHHNFVNIRDFVDDSRLGRSFSFLERKCKIYASFV